MLENLRESDAWGVMLLAGILLIYQLGPDVLRTDREVSQQETSQVSAAVQKPPKTSPESVEERCANSRRPILKAVTGCAELQVVVYPVYRVGSCAH